jgi:DNA end-binding protein Ku
MPAHAMSSGTVSFGLVTIPVKLYSTSESSSGISFNMLHDKCKGRLKQQYICTVDGELVERSAMVKGYEYAKGQYVTFTKEELDAFEAKATNAIEITEFVPAEQVDPVYFEKAYYLGPDKGGDRPYLLLAEAMRETGKAALARYAARGKDYLVLLRPYQNGLIMQQLRYPDEIKAFSEVPIGEATVKPAELALARQLIEQISAEQFEPGQYRDTQREKTRELIEQKIAGADITVAPVEEPKAQIIDLMAALKASLSGTQKPGEAGRKGPQAVADADGEAGAGGARARG